MDMRNEFHQWLYEEVAVLKEGRVFLVKNRQNGMLAVKNAANSFISANII